MTGWIIKFILLAVIVHAVLRLLRGIVDGMRVPRDDQPVAVPLVRDPVCGTFVVRSRALTGGSGADTQFFCSESCRREYELKPGRQASAGGKPPQAVASAQRDGARKRGPIEQGK